MRKVELAGSGNSTRLDHVREQLCSKSLTARVEFVCSATTVKVLTYVNGSGRKRAGARIRELLSYHLDNLVLGLAF